MNHARLWGAWVAVAYVLAGAVGFQATADTSLLASTNTSLTTFSAQQAYQLKIQHDTFLNDHDEAKPRRGHKRHKKNRDVATELPQSQLLDDFSRTIGGNEADQLKPAQKYVFEVPRVTNQPMWLTIGSLEGIHTPQAHALGQTTDTHISSPLTIKLNGKAVQYIHTNGQNIQIRLPAHLLRADGYNTLQVQAGYYFPKANTIAYDVITFSNVRLESA